MDAVQAGRMRNWLDTNLAADQTLLMVTHDLPYAMQLCPRAVILDGGTRLLGRYLPIARGWRLALVVLLAAMGSYVPAQACRLGPVDAIHTRIGAADDLAKATDIARSMVTRYGMDPGLGHATYEADRLRIYPQEEKFRQDYELVRSHVDTRTPEDDLFAGVREALATMEP